MTEFQQLRREIRKATKKHKVRSHLFRQLFQWRLKELKAENARRNECAG